MITSFYGRNNIQNMIDTAVAGNKTVIIEKNGIDVVLKLTENGKSKSWLITGYDTSISKDAEREFRATLGATQNLPTFGRQELGAVLTDMSITQAYKNVNHQIKSVNNRGTFDAGTGNIYFQSKQSGKGVLMIQELYYKLFFYKTVFVLCAFYNIYCRTK